MVGIRNAVLVGTYRPIDCDVWDQSAATEPQRSPLDRWQVIRSWSHIDSWGRLGAKKRRRFQLRDVRNYDVALCNTFLQAAAAQTPNNLVERYKGLDRWMQVARLD